MKTRKVQHRKYLEIVYGELYEFEAFGDRMKCAYCNDVRSSIDHIPALAVVDSIGTKKLREKGVKFIKVPCCSFCNGTLLDRRLANYEERLVFIYNTIQNKLEKETLWTDAEINELGGNLKKMVKARQLEIRRELINRLRGVETNLSRLEIAA